MNLADVMDDLGAACEQIDGLRVYPYWADTLTPPAAVVVWPDPMTYDETMARGGDRAEMRLYVIAGRVDARSARDTLARYVDGSGTHSIKQAVESYTATAYDTARVMRAEFENIIVGRVEYLSALFYIDVMGKGAQ